MNNKVIKKQRLTIVRYNIGVEILKRKTFQNHCNFS